MGFRASTFPICQFSLKFIMYLFLLLSLLFIKSIFNTSIIWRSCCKPPGYLPIQGNALTLCCRFPGSNRTRQSPRKEIMSAWYLQVLHRRAKVFGAVGTARTHLSAQMSPGSRESWGEQAASSGCDSNPV